MSGLPDGDDCGQEDNRVENHQAWNLIKMEECEFGCENILALVNGK